MPVTFVNGSGTFSATDFTTQALTPGAGSDCIVGAYLGPDSIGAVTATFNGDVMTVMNQLVGDGSGGLFGRSIGWFRRTGDYTGASRDFVLSAAGSPLVVAAFGGVDQASPILHTATPVRESAASSVSITVSAANNPSGSRIVWWVTGFGTWSGAGSVNIGTIHLEPDDFGSRVGALGSVAGNGADQTITFTLPSGTTALLIYAVVLREAGGGGGGSSAATVVQQYMRRWGLTG